MYQSPSFSLQWIQAVFSGTILLHPAGKMKKSFGDRSFSDRSFSVAAPTPWNTLPVSLRNTDSILTFKSSLKTYLFKLAFSFKFLNYLVIVHISSQYLYRTDFIVFIGKHNSFVYNLLVTSILYDFF